MQALFWDEKNEKKKIQENHAASSNADEFFKIFRTPFCPLKRYIAQQGE